MRNRWYRRKGESLVWGLFLITLGVAFLLTNSGVWPNDALRHWWPLLVVVVGLGSVAAARDPHGVGGGVTTAAIGGWLLVAANGWYGLGWSRSWPLSFVAIGLGTLAEALVARFWRESEENGHGI